MGRPARTSVAGTNRSTVGLESNSKDQRTYLTIRVLCHLARFGRPHDNGLGRVEATQRGMANCLSTSQGAISWILTRLVAAQAVQSQVNHVHGVDRRVRVYSLTRRGELLSQEIESKAPTKPQRTQL
jgi:DNA-binding MarR family transcriptional regulator